LGNTAFKSNNLDEARKQYEEAYEFADVPSDDEDENLSCSKFKTVLEGNKAAVYLKLKDWSSAIESCDKVLKSDPVNLKALYRRSQAKTNHGLYEESNEDLQECLKIEPNNT
jgi:FK506-binding protein 4/5